MTDPQRLAEVEAWLKLKEGENLEFKEAKQSYDTEKLLHYCCALANERGGRIVLGVTDKRPRRVVGSAAFPQPERVRQRLIEVLHVNVDFEEIAHPDCRPESRVLTFVVASRPIGKPVQDDKGIAWIRRGESLVPMSDDRRREIYEEGPQDFSAKICSEATPADLDPAAVEGFRKRWVAKVRRVGNDATADRLAAMPQASLLADADAVVDGKVTYAALILFGTPQALTRRLRQAEVVFEYRSSDASGPAADRIEFRQGFFAFYDAIWERIDLRNDKQSFQEGFFVHQMRTFDERSVREAVLNAVSHRDYQLSGSVFVRQFPQRLEIDSPGGFPSGVTLENFLDRQMPRNRLIAEIFMRCGLVERSGQGMNLIFEEAVRHGKACPDFPRTDAYQVGMTLHGLVQDKAFVRFVERIGRQSTAGFATQDWMLLGAIARDGKAPKGLSDRVGRLVDLGLVERGGGRKLLLSRKYYEFAGDAPAYTRKKGLDREQNLALLLNHIAAHAATGVKLDELCEVLSALPMTQVQSLVRTLKRRGLTHLGGSTKGGRWFPGPSPEMT